MLNEKLHFDWELIMNVTHEIFCKGCMSECVDYLPNIKF